MLKFIAPEVWSFDAEWIPDVATGRRVYDLAEAATDDEVLRHMWSAGGATEEAPQPYLKTVLCRVVSVAVVIRKCDEAGTVSLKLHSLPPTDTPGLDERELIDRFLSAIGKAKPQLVGFNSLSADLPILIQRAIVNGVTSPRFCARPGKPWEGVDYFSKASDYSIDLKDELGSWGKGTPSLHEIATASGIPGKIDTSGHDVVQLWREGKIDRIVQYNECDALTTYLLWLRLAHLSGLLGTGAYLDEQAQLESYLTTLVASSAKSHIEAFLARWRQLRSLTSQPPRSAA